MKRILLLSIAILFGLNYYSQEFPIQITTVVPSPYPQTFEEALGLGNNSFIILNNTDMLNSHEIKLTAKISSDNGILVEVSPEATPSQPIILAPGETRTVFGQELESLYLNYTESDITYSGVDLPQIINNPYMPEGTYSFCIKAFDYNTSVPLSNELISGCAAPVYITTISPPIITYPFDQQEVTALIPQQLIFSWTPVSFNSPNVRYAFQMVDYTDLNVNVYDLLDESDFNYYSEENIMGNTLIYGPNLPSLVTGHNYAIRVKAYLMGDELNIENDGFSDVVQFQYVEGNFNIISPGFTDLNISIDPFSSNNTIPNFTGTLTGGFDLGDLLDIDLGGYGTIETEGTTVDDNPPLMTTDLGCDAGCNAIAISDQISVEIESNDIVNIGNFQMQVFGINGSPSSGYSGEGFVTLDELFSPLPMKVNFSNLKMNAAKQIISGEATAEIRTGSWLKDSWNNTQKKFEGVNYGNNPTEVLDNAMSEEFRLDRWDDLTESAAITLPAGYGSDIVDGEEQNNYQVQITEMVFGPDQATFDAMVMIPIPDDMDGTKHLIFAASNICISPSGPSIGSSPAQLSLSQSVRYRTTDDFALEINALGNADLGEGTFAELDCQGFFRANISGQVLFSPDFLVIEAEDGTLNNTDTLSAAFTAEFESWDSWIGELSFIDQNNSSAGKLSSTRFQYSGLEGYTYKLDFAKFDHDINANLTGMTFPEAYSGSSAQDWQGLFINDMEVLLPKWAKDDSNDERMSINAQTLLIDASGLSGQFDGTNLAQLDDGNLGGWDFSVDEAHLKIVSNEFQNGDLAGKLRIPITDDPLNYTANIQHAQNQTQHNFEIITTGEIDLPAFLAEITLAENSSISVDIAGDNDVLVEAQLHGHIDLPEQIGDIPGCNIEDISFDDMVIKNHGEVFSIGSFGTENLASSLAVASIGVGLNALDFNKLDGAIDKYNLGFELNVQLGESNAGVTGIGDLYVIAKNIGATPQDFNLTHDDSGIDAFNITGNLPGVNLTGMVEFFDNETLGHGFTGQLEANFIDNINVQARAMFGTKEIENDNKKFFLVEGMGTLATGFPLAGPVSIYGFGGGVYYNIKPSNNFQLNATEGEYEPPTLTSIADKYVFDEGALGLKAACVMGLTPPDVFNADVGLTIFLNTEDFSVDSMNLAGEGYMMTKITDRNNPMMTIDANIGYNFTSQILHGEMTMELEAPKVEEPLITAEGTMKLHASPGGYWYLKIGAPDDPISGTVDLKIVKPTLKAYFMSGHDLPSPILPDYVQDRFPDFNPSFAGGGASTGTGVAMGVHARVVSEIDVIVAYMNLDVGAGFDFTALSYDNALCNGNNEFGINQWYANVQGYIYGDLAFTTLDYEWLSVEAGVIVDGALPNPTGFQGVATFSVETFLKDFSVNETFSIGEICQMQAVLDENGEVVTSSSPIQGLNLIKNVSPGSAESEVDLFATPKIQYHIDPNETLEFSYPNGNGGVINENVVFDRQVIWEEKVGGNFIPVNHTEVWSEASKTYTYSRVTEDNTALEIGRPNTQHRFYTSIKPKRMVNGSYEYFTDEDDGSTLQEVKDHYYTTGKNINSINDAHISFCRPYRRQRYVTPEDYNNAIVQFNVSYTPAFEAYIAEGYSFDAEIYEDGVDAPVIIESIDYSEDLQALYNIEALGAEKIYKVVFSAKKTIELEAETNDVYASTGNTDISGVEITSGSTNVNIFDNNSASNNSSTNVETIEYIWDKVDMFTYFFRTSKYRSLEDKVNSYSIVNTYIENKPTDITVGQLGNLPPGNAPLDFLTYQSLNMEFSGGEPFEEMDFFAPPNQVGNSVRQGHIVSFNFLPAYWYPSNPYLECDPFGILDIDNPEIQSESKLGLFQDFKLKSQFSTSGGLDNLSFDVEYIGISSSLSDGEILGNQGSTQSNFGGFFNTSNSPTDNGNFTLIWNGDLIAKQLMCTQCLGMEPEESIYQPLFSAPYFQFQLKTNDVDMHWETHKVDKTFTVNLQAP